MTHPFDTIAVEAAAKAYLRAKNNITTDAAWKATTPEMQKVLISFQDDALSAAFKSAKEREMAREGVAIEKNGNWLARSQSHSGSNTIPVTIIRHKEPT